MKKLVFLVLLSSALLTGRTAQAQIYRSASLDSAIAFYVNEVNADSIRAYMQALEDMGTRFCLADNRRDVSVWIKNKFIALGYPDTKLDSFQLNRWYGNQYYQTWQYNVVSTHEGYLYPNQVYILGAHHDAIVPQSSNPFVIAPGADDNASGVAAALEVARIMKLHNYMPESTIRFITFAAEELGLHGAWHYADNAATESMDIKAMINNDMISYTTLPEDQWTLRIQKYPNSLWLTDLTKYIAQNFTNLKITEGTQYIQYSDSWPFYYNGYHAVFLHENEFTPFYHTVNDLVSTTNKYYTAEMVKVSMGMLIHENGPGLATGVAELEIRPSAVLHQNHPNPFAGQTTIKYTLTEAGFISLQVFDLSNRMIRQVDEGYREAGSHRVSFNGASLPAGIYICRLQTPTGTQTIKMAIRR